MLQRDGTITAGWMNEESRHQYYRSTALTFITAHHCVATFIDEAATLNGLKLVFFAARQQGSLQAKIRLGKN